MPALHRERRESPTTSFYLTAHEVAVIELLTQGYRPLDIAVAQRTTIGAVRQAMQRLRGRLGCQNDMHLIALLLRYRLVDAAALAAGAMP